jgi:hypothetical protein
LDGIEKDDAEGMLKLVLRWLEELKKDPENYDHFYFYEMMQIVDRRIMVDVILDRDLNKENKECVNLLESHKDKSCCYNCAYWRRQEWQTFCIMERGDGKTWCEWTEVVTEHSGETSGQYDECNAIFLLHQVISDDVIYQPISRCTDKCSDFLKCGREGNIDVESLSENERLLLGRHCANNETHVNVRLFDIKEPGWFDDWEIALPFPRLYLVKENPNMDD